MPAEQLNYFRTRTRPEFQTKRQGSVSPRIQNSSCFGPVKVDPYKSEYRMYDRKRHAVLHLVS